MNSKRMCLINTGAVIFSVAVALIWWPHLAGVLIGGLLNVPSAVLNGYNWWKESWIPIDQALDLDELPNAEYYTVSDMPSEQDWNEMFARTPKRKEDKNG